MNKDVENKAPKELSKKSLARLFSDYNAALDRFRAANKEIPTDEVCKAALLSFMNFPYSWMGYTGTQTRLPEVMKFVAEEFLRLRIVKDNGGSVPQSQA